MSWELLQYSSRLCLNPLCVLGIITIFFKTLPQSTLCLGNYYSILQDFALIHFVSWELLQYSSLCVLGIITIFFKTLPQSTLCLGNYYNILQDFALIHFVSWELLQYSSRLCLNPLCVLGIIIRWSAYNRDAKFAHSVN